MRLGDLVINRTDPHSLIFQVTGFDGEYVIVRIIGVPLTTVFPRESLVKISSVPALPPLRVIRGRSAKCS